MLTHSDALALVNRQLRNKAPLDDEWVVAAEGTIEKPHCWIFFYNSRKYIETGVIGHALAGNGPAIVSKHDGTVEFFGALQATEEFLAAYDAKLGGRPACP